MALDTPAKVLIAPLDWGLGHATRCIPIIRAFVGQGSSVTVAATVGQQALLQAEFPDLEILQMEGYGIRYSTGQKTLTWGILIRIPAILKAIRRENDWLKNLCSQRTFDLIISDNRYGFYHRKIPGVFITHQLYIQSGLGGLANRLLLRWNSHLIQSFSECWVPDFQHPFSLSGLLSRPPHFPPIPVKYIGPLSRFRREKNEEVLPLLVMISGPEPQRSVFEDLLLKALEDYTQRVVLLRGLPGDQPEIKSANRHVEIHNHLKSDDLQHFLNAAEKVVCRSGYSSIMDLAQLRKKAILIPTPGQPEQEYLGRYLAEKRWALVIQQRDFNLKQNIQMLEEQNFGFPEMPEPLFSQKTASTFLEKIIAKRP